MAIDWSTEHEKFMRIAYARTLTAARRTVPELRTCTTTGLGSDGKTCQAKGKPAQATGAAETTAS